MPNVTCVPKDSTALGTPSRRTRSCPPGTRQREAFYLNEDHERGLPQKLDDKTCSDSNGIVADSVSLGSLLDADETGSQDQGKASSGVGTPGRQGSKLMIPRMSGSAHHHHHQQ